MSMLKILVGFAPWFVFGLVATREGPGAVTTAALLAFVVAVALLIHGKLHGRSPKVLEVAAAVVFLVIGGFGALNPAADPFLAQYGRGLATFTLAAVIFLMLPVMPFTEQYARETVPQEYWHSPTFRSVNRRISAVWGGVILAHAVCHTIAAVLSEPAMRIPTRPVDLLLNWIVPVLLTLWAYRYTARVSGGAHEAAQSRAAHRAQPQARP